MCATLALIAIFLIVLAARPHDASLAWKTTAFTLLWGWIGLVVVTAGSVWVNIIVVRKELALGYTSSRAFPDVITVDPRTGVVLREAGEPLLSRPEFRDALVKAKTWAQQHPDQVDAR
ncbi:hypothetical protein D4765_19040 [Subtercola vilae]|uniref:Uncharacterized protein n=1 Tax=Subtercola vilae TaxID=2056433 RepID=A0A4T2B6D6_9MICO|nr:hypothetical protein D4765_19040 [Subtercola vilae]